MKDILGRDIPPRDDSPPDFKCDNEDCDGETCQECCQHDDQDDGYCLNCEMPAHEFLNFE